MYLSKDDEQPINWYVKEWAEDPAPIPVFPETDGDVRKPPWQWPLTRGYVAYSCYYVSLLFVKSKHSLKLLVLHKYETTVV